MFQGNVYLVDDDARVRTALTNLLESRGFTVFSFGSADLFLDRDHSDAPSCLVLDLRMPVMNGLQLQQALQTKTSLPIIFISAHGNIPSTVKAMKAGAIEFLEKPVNSEALIEAVKGALALAADQKKREAIRSRLQERYRTLTSREREVLPLVVGGFLNKQAAAHLGIAEVTFEVHKRNVISKMNADSIADLVRIAAQLGIQPLTPSMLATESAR